MMNIVLRISLIIFALVLIYVITKVLKRGRMPIKYSLLWYFSALVILLVAIIPISLEFFSNLLGFETLSNLIIGIFIGLLLFLTMSLTIIISGQNKKITLLIQEISLLKQKVKEEKNEICINDFIPYFY